MERVQNKGLYSTLAFWGKTALDLSLRCTASRLKSALFWLKILRDNIQSLIFSSFLCFLQNNKQH